MIKRKIEKIKYVAAIVFTITILFTFHVVKAANEADVKSQEGQIFYQTEDTKATSGIRWKTIGFVITREKCLTGSKANGGYPKGKTSGDYFSKNHAVIMLEEKWKQEYVTGNVVNVNFTIPKAVIDKALLNAGFDEIQDNDILYLHGIHQVTHNGVDYGSRKYDLPSIMKAEAWKNPDDFQDRFDIKVEYKGASSEPVAVTYKTPSGSIIESKELSKTKWEKLGKSVDFTFDEKKTHHGKGYVLNKSYINYYFLGKPIPDTGYSKANGNTYQQILNRKVRQKLGGVEFVAIMKEKNEVVPEEKEDEMGAELVYPNPSGVIGADVRGREEFDVAEGIPTLETLYTNVFSENFLLGYRFVKVMGQKKYPIVVKKTYHLYWTALESDGKGGWKPVEKSSTRQVSQNITVIRDYAYWKIANIDYYKIGKATIQNYGFPNGTMTLEPASYQIPKLAYTHNQEESAHIKEPAYPMEIQLGAQTVYSSSPPSEDFTSDAEGRVGQIQVKNDTMVFGKDTIMSGVWKDVRTEEPKRVEEEPEEIGENVLYGYGLKIEGTKQNGNYTTKGSITYERVQSLEPKYSSKLTFEIGGMNEVVIHTPVICDGTVSDQRNANQMISPDVTKASLILDQDFTISFPTLGEHKYIKGYGYRDYGKYIATRQIQFPFSVYQGNTYIPSNTWITIKNELTSFYLPIWVKEGKYKILLRAKAMNAVNDSKTESMANLNLEHTMAVDFIDVEVSGRLYGLSLYDISDYPLWQSVFRKPDSLAPTGFYYGVGTRDQNGAETGRSKEYTLALLDGSHPNFQNAGTIKLGYVTRFYLTTVGEMYGSQDYIRIKPRFFYVDKQGKNRQEVDLYYDETISGKKEYLVKVGSELDKRNKKAYRLGDLYLSVPKTEIDTKAQIEEKSIKEIKEKKENLFTYANIMIPSGFRTYIGKNYAPGGKVPMEVNGEMLTKSMQKWYCEYYLPANVHVAKKGFDVKMAAAKKRIDYSEYFWLKNGYIIVNFEIESIRMGEPYLSYCNQNNMENGYCNMWKKEGFQYSKIDAKGNTFSLLDGDYVLYQTDQSAGKDYISGGTH